MSPLVWTDGTGRWEERRTGQRTFLSRRFAAVLFHNDKNMSSGHEDSAALR